ncbi:PEP-CTERM motif protein [Limihaloglobus sulfuriphilus]|uniref:PEP-CTERM motif protein n=1 Tax=Limihaloglobus sulfuriphilus TaxID=1851148 RepID=A0A1R7T667_9BACT|nr:choice-of-anchor R domain-containing protein [Limihaloglobus sulfuriphilus]AQQ72403.1 PEP-CTERM motif protein [Limihaloglobus sulfuriphilus]
MRKTLFIAVAILIAAATAQSAVVCSNIDNTTDVWANTWGFTVTQQFTVDSNPETIKTVRVAFDIHGTAASFSSEGGTLSIYANDRSTKLGDFTTGDTIYNGTNEFVNNSGVALSANTSYWVFVSGFYAGVDLTNNASQAGWAIRDKIDYSSDPFLGAMKIELDTVPEPATMLILGLGGLVLNVTRRRA